MSREKKSAVIGIFNSHREALEAIKVLKEENFNMKHVALVGKGEAVSEIDGIHTWEDATIKGTEVGAIVGGALGLLTGLGLIAIPGVGVLYVAGSLAGALLTGLEGTFLGSLGGTLVGAIVGGIEDGAEGHVDAKKMAEEDAKKYEEYIKDGKYLVIVQGTDKEAKRGHDILTRHHEKGLMGTHLIN